MLLAQGKRSLEDAVLQILHNGGLDGPSLLAAVKKKSPRVSRETFYRTLRSLLKEEVLNKHAAIYQLNRQAPR
jgi:Fe2+ or Zn2+ uptake regulation protein